MNENWMNVTTKMAQDAQDALNKMTEENTKVMQKMFENQTGMLNETMQAWQTGFERLAETKDVAEAAKVQGETARACGEIVMGAFKDNIAAMNAAREEFRKMFEENVKTATGFMEKITDEVSKAAPAKRARKSS